MTKTEMLNKVEESARLAYSYKLKGDAKEELKHRKQMLDDMELALYEGVDGNEIEDARRNGCMKAWKES